MWSSIWKCLFWRNFIRRLNMRKDLQATSIQPNVWLMSKLYWRFSNGDKSILHWRSFDWQTSNATGWRSRTSDKNTGARCPLTRGRGAEPTGEKWLDNKDCHNPIKAMGFAEQTLSRSKSDLKWKASALETSGQPFLYQVTVRFVSFFPPIGLRKQLTLVHLFFFLL